MASHQKNYQDSLRAIKSRLKLNHRDAQAVYRMQRDVLGPKVPASKFLGYSEGHIKRIARKALKTPIRQPLNVLFEGTEAAFSLRRIAEDDGLFEPTDVDRMVVTVRSFEGGESGPDTTIERRNVSASEFWKTYFDMVRAFIKGEKERSGTSPDAVLVAGLAVAAT